MKKVHINTGKSLSRRTVLRGVGGVALGLALARCHESCLRRINSLQTAQALHRRQSFAGPSQPLPCSRRKRPGLQTLAYLKSLQDIRDDFTVVSGSSHPGVTGGHTAEGSIFSACPNSRGSTSRNTISIDQLMAKHLGHETRFPSLVLNTGNERSPSYTENGAMIPAMTDPRKLFTKLFVDDSPAAKKGQTELVRGGQSVLDIVGAEAKALEREVGAGDRAKLEAWFNSVRELEQSARSRRKPGSKSRNRL